jgi:hypothetical protein
MALYAQHRQSLPREGAQRRHLRLVVVAQHVGRHLVDEEDEDVGAWIGGHGCGAPLAGPGWERQDTSAVVTPTDRRKDPK